MIKSSRFLQVCEEGRITRHKISLVTHVLLRIDRLALVCSAQALVFLLPNPFTSQILSLPNQLTSKSVHFQILLLLNPFTSKSFRFQNMLTSKSFRMRYERRFTACSFKTTPRRHLSPLHAVAAWPMAKRAHG